MAKIDAFFKLMGDQGASDLHMVAGSQPVLRIRGEIRNVDTRTMTVLAEFAQSLTSLPAVASATTPTFAREEDSKIGFHSPFDITLTLK